MLSTCHDKELWGTWQANMSRRRGLRLALIASPANTRQRRVTTPSPIALIASPANTRRRRARQIAWNVSGLLGLCIQVQRPAQIAVLATILMPRAARQCVLRVTRACSLRQTEPLRFRPARPARLGRSATLRAPLSVSIVLGENTRGAGGHPHPTSA